MMAASVMFEVKSLSDYPFQKVILNNSFVLFSIEDMNLEIHAYLVMYFNSH